MAGLVVGSLPGHLWYCFCCKTFTENTLLLGMRFVQHSGDSVAMDTKTSVSKI